MCLEFFPHIGLMKERLNTKKVSFEQYTFPLPTIITHHQPDLEFAASKCLADSEIKKLKKLTNYYMHTYYHLPATFSRVAKIHSN